MMRLETALAPDCRRFQTSPFCRQGRLSNPIRWILLAVSLRATGALLADFIPALIDCDDVTLSIYTK